MIRGQVLNKHKGHARMFLSGHGGKEGFKCRESSGRSAYADDGETHRGFPDQLLRLVCRGFVLASSSCSHVSCHFPDTRTTYYNVGNLVLCFFVDTATYCEGRNAISERVPTPQRSATSTSEYVSEPIKRWTQLLRRLCLFAVHSSNNDSRVSMIRLSNGRERGRVRGVRMCC